jgi:hypothetical protein
MMSYFIKVMMYSRKNNCIFITGQIGSSQVAKHPCSDPPHVEPTEGWITDEDGYKYFPEVMMHTEEK